MALATPRKTDNVFLLQVKITNLCNENIELKAHIIPKLEDCLPHKINGELVLANGEEM